MQLESDTRHHHRLQGAAHRVLRLHQVTRVVIPVAIIHLDHPITLRRHHHPIIDQRRHPRATSRALRTVELVSTWPHEIILNLPRLVIEQQQGAVIVPCRLITHQVEREPEARTGSALIIQPACHHLTVVTVVVWTMCLLIQMTSHCTWNSIDMSTRLQRSDSLCICRSRSIPKWMIRAFKSHKKS